MLDELLAAVDAVSRSETIGAAVLTGRGRAFSAGGDIAAMHAMDETVFAATIARYMRVSAAFRACPRPIVAAIHGYALAGGFELAVMCDVRFAAAGHEVRPARHATRPESDEWDDLAPARIVGLGRAMYLTLSADPIDAEEAEVIGLVDRLTRAETVLDEAKHFARRIASYPRTGVEWTKIGYMRALESDFETATRSEEAAELACFQSPETRARFRAFIERRRG